MMHIAIHDALNAIDRRFRPYTFDKRLLVDHVERVIYNRYSVTIVGSVPVQSATGETKLQFRIEGKIDIAAIRSAASRRES
jgi:hypothetical protein